MRISPDKYPHLHSLLHVMCVRDEEDKYYIVDGAVVLETMGYDLDTDWDYLESCVGRLLSEEREKLINSDVDDDVDVQAICDRVDPTGELYALLEAPWQ